MAALNEITGIAGQSRSAYANLLKEYYSDLWDDHVHTENQVMSLIGKKKGRMGGKRVVAAVVDELPQSAGISLLEGKQLPDPTTGNYFNPEIISRGLYTRLRWTVEVELAARAGDKAAWAKPRKLDVENARKQFDLNVARKAFLGYGDILGVVSSYNAGTDVVTLQPRNSRTSSGAAFWYFGHHYMKKNMEIGFVDTTDGALGGDTTSSYDLTTQANSTKISAKGGTDAAPTITLSTSIDSTGPIFTPAVGDFVVPFQNRVYNSSNAIAAAPADAISQFSSINGILNLATDATIYAASYGLAKSGRPTLSGLYDDNSGTVRVFEEARVMLFVDRIHDEGTGNEPDCLLLNRAVRREVVQEHDGDRRYAPVQTASGFGKLVAHVGDTELPYISDWYCPPGMVIGLNKSAWGWVSLADMQPVDQSLERWVADYAQHEILWMKHGNLYCTRPYDQGVMDDIEFDMFALTA